MPKILLVDNEKYHIRALRHLLIAQGIPSRDIFLAECVDETLEIYRANPDLKLLVTDCSMPLVKNGTEVNSAGKKLLDELRLQGFNGDAVLRTSIHDCDDIDFVARFEKFGDPEVVVAKCMELLQNNPERGREFKRNK